MIWSIRIQHGQYLKRHNPVFSWSVNIGEHFCQNRTVQFSWYLIKEVSQNNETSHLHQHRLCDQWNFAVDISCLSSIVELFCHEKKWQNSQQQDSCLLTKLGSCDHDRQLCWCVYWDPKDELQHIYIYIYIYNTKQQVYKHTNNTTL